MIKKSSLFWFCAVALFFIFIAATKKDEAQLKTVDYTLVATNGNSHDVAISPDDKTLENMKLLAVQLENEYGSRQNADVFVFDDEELARQAEQIRSANLDDDDPLSISYDTHFVAMYFKTPAGRHDFTIMLDGINGKSETIDYKTTDMENFKKDLPHIEKKESKKAPLYEYVLAIGILILIAAGFIAFKKLLPGNTRLTLRDTDPLPVVEPQNIILHDDEVCHFSTDADYVTVKNVVTGRVSTGSGRSARILGMRYSDGKGYSQSVRENVAEKTTGNLTITNRRIIFSGMKGAFEKKLSDITSVLPYDDGIGVQFGDKHYTLQFRNAGYAYAIIMRLLSNR